jgi:hypothetical protein
MLKALQIPETNIRDSAGYLRNKRTLFSRSDTQVIARFILESGPGTSSSSGVFFLSPRNDGRVDFIENDLRPAIEQMGALVVYVDLLADPSADPGHVIREAIIHAGRFQRWSLTRTLADLSQEVKKPIVLIIDEVQLALSSEYGRNILFTLKAARDALNSSMGGYGLRIMAISPDRDAMLRLTGDVREAFFCAPLYTVDI